MSRWMTLVAVFALFLMLTDRPPSSAQVPSGTGKGTTQKDAETLKKVFGASQVTVFLLQNPQPVSGTLTDIVEVLGRRFVQITDNTGRQYLLNPDLITIIRQQ